MNTETWSVDIYLNANDDGMTHVEAVLRTRVGTELGRVSTAYTSAVGGDMQKGSEEFSACRALSALAHDLLTATVVDVRQHAPAWEQPWVGTG